MVSERRVIAPDGIELFVRVFGATVSPSAGDRVPVLCLPGLTRNSRDFVPLAEAVAPQRPVAAVDFRGRGYSGYDPTGDSYLPDVYASDMVARSFFDHQSPDGVTLDTRLARVGYSYELAGENIAWGEGVLATPAFAPWDICLRISSAYFPAFKHPSNLGTSSPTACA